MIQRIQSIFLLLAGGGILGLLKFPLARTAEPIADSALFADAAFNLQDNHFMLGAFAAAGFLLVLSIFLFNNRKLQLTLTLTAVLLTMVGVSLAAFQWFQDTATAVAEPSVGVILPLLTIIFSILAHKYINKDEKLVKSADRLR